MAVVVTPEQIRRIEALEKLIRTEVVRTLAAIEERFPGGADRARLDMTYAIHARGYAGDTRAVVVQSSYPEGVAAALAEMQLHAQTVPGYTRSYTPEDLIDG